MSTTSQPTTHLLYLHGFRSSPLSAKAQRMAAWMRVHRPDVVWCCPQLPPSPREAIDRLSDVLSGWPPAGRSIVGSSLGGFYATVLAERFGCRAVLLNPAVTPARDLASQIGELRSWHGDGGFRFERQHVDELRQLTPAAISSPQRYFAVIAKGDEVLDWREMQSRYAGCRIELLEGGDHALTDFDTHLPAITAFLGLDRG